MAMVQLNSANRASLAMLLPFGQALAPAGAENPAQKSRTQPDAAISESESSCPWTLYDTTAISVPVSFAVDHQSAAFGAYAGSGSGRYS
jgi:hypothetical protein